MAFDMPIERVSFVALDLETTGLAPGFDRITEVGAVRFRVAPDGRVTAGPRFERLVDPGRPIPLPIERLTGISDEMVAGAPLVRDVLPALLEFLAAESPTVVLAHNARFDLSFLVAAAHRSGDSWVGPPMVCTVDIARRSLPDAPRYGLGHLVEYLGCNGGGGAFHRGLADALHARNLFSRCVSHVGSASLRGLGVHAPVPIPDARDFEVEIPERLTPLEPCIEAQRRVEMTYRGGSKGRHLRPVTPLAFYMRGGVLYLRAWCHLDDVAKNFRCDRISALGP